MRALVAIVSAGLAVSTGAVTQLTPATQSAFDRYVASTERRMDAELAGTSPFLWIDRQPAPERTRILRELQQGKVISARLETREGGQSIDPGDGLIHHWVGTVLLPGVTLDKTRAFVQDYDRYADHFAPMIQRSRLVSRAGDRFVVSFRTWSRKLGVTVVMDGDYTVDYRSLGPAKMFTKSVGRNFHEIESPGSAAERRHPADHRNSYLWRLNTYCSFEQRSEGVYEQCESISLTRSIPWAARWIVSPLVTGIPRDTLEMTLGAVRAKLR